MALEEDNNAALIIDEASRHHHLRLPELDQPKREVRKYERYDIGSAEIEERLNSKGEFYSVDLTMADVDHTERDPRSGGENEISNSSDSNSPSISEPISVDELLNGSLDYLREFESPLKLHNSRVEIVENIRNFDSGVSDGRCVENSDVEDLRSAAENDSGITLSDRCWNENSATETFDDSLRNLVSENDEMRKNGVDSMMKSLEDIASGNQKIDDVNDCEIENGISSTEGNDEVNSAIETDAIPNLEDDSELKLHSVSRNEVQMPTDFCGSGSEEGQELSNCKTVDSDPTKSVNDRESEVDKVCVNNGSTDSGPDIVPDGTVSASCEPNKNDVVPKREIDENCDNYRPTSVVEQHDCFKNPLFVTLANDLEDSRNLVKDLRETVDRLENQLSIEKSQAERISLLEQRIAQQERELNLSRQEHDLDLRTIATLRKEMDIKLDALKKQYEKANKDKESMVMRYVTSEKELIDRKKEREVLDRKLKEQQKENESISAKFKTVSVEKTRITQLHEQKVAELTTASKEIEKLKEEINSREIKIKWIQNRVKTEMDLHKECPEKIEKLTATVCRLEEELDVAKTQLENLDKEHLESRAKKAFEQQMQEERAKLIVERHEHSEREAKLKTLQSKNHALIEENNNLSVKVQNLEQERFDFEQKLIRAREDVRIYSQTVSELQSRIVEMDILSKELQQEKEKFETTSHELERLRKSNEELMSDMSSCRNREAEMLAFTQKLTTKNVQLQSEFSAVEAKATMLDSEHQRAEEAMSGLKSRVKSLEREVKEEQARRLEEVHLMARQLAESTTRVEALEASVEDYRGEISVLRNKHATTVRELQRELQQHKKKLDQYEFAGVGSGTDSLCQGSRTSSLSSLNNETTVQTQTNSFQFDVSPQALVDRIVRLQHEIARQKERIEFLEDHSGQLTRELQKKSRLLQSYILKEEAGALSSRSMDSNKAEVTKHGGIMASLYGSKLADDTMTLELSLEINHKLQALLEDTLLKNMTLKENIDTLGDEIARLSRQKFSN